MHVQVRRGLGAVRETAQRRLEPQLVQRRGPQVVDDQPQPRDLRAQQLDGLAGGPEPRERVGLAGLAVADVMCFVMAGLLVLVFLCSAWTWMAFRESHDVTAESQRFF